MHLYNSGYPSIINENSQDYQRRTFGEKFKSYSLVRKLRRNYSNMRTADFYYKPLGYKPSLEKIFKSSLRSDEPIFDLCPVANGITHLIWFDVDCSKEHGDIETEVAARKIFDTLKSYGLHPELALSSYGGNYHICCWFENPQSIGFCMTVQKYILTELNLKWVEFGPKFKLSIRPWHFIHSFKDTTFIELNGIKYINEQIFKFGSKLLERGSSNLDLSVFRFLFRKIKGTARILYTNNTYNHQNPPSIENYIPMGGETNEKLLRVCRDFKAAGYNDEQIIELAVEMHQKGTVSKNLGQHVKQCWGILKSTKVFKASKTIDNSIFWNSVPKGLKDYELFKGLKDWTEKNSSFKSFMVRSEDFGAYLNISWQGARKRLKKYEKSGALIIFEKGQKGGKAYKYTLGTNWTP